MTSEIARSPPLLVFTGRIPGSQFPLPFQCPLDHVFEMEQVRVLICLPGVEQGPGPNEEITRVDTTPGMRQIMMQQSDPLMTEAHVHQRGCQPRQVAATTCENPLCFEHVGRGSKPHCLAGVRQAAGVPCLEACMLAQVSTLCWCQDAVPLNVSGLVPARRFPSSVRDKAK